MDNDADGGGDGDVDADVDADVESDGLDRETVFEQNVSRAWRCFHPAVGALAGEWKR